MSGSSRLVARSLIRSWWRHRLRAIAALLGVVVAAMLATTVASVSATMVDAIQGGTASTLLDADVVAVARSASGMSEDAMQRIEDAAGDADTVGVLNVNTRLATNRDSILAVFGVTEGVDKFVPPSQLAEIDAVPAESGTAGLFVGEVWAGENDLQAGDVIELAAPGGTASFTVSGLIPGELPNQGSIGITTIDEVGSSFGRSGQIDAVYFRVGDADSIDALTDRVEVAGSGSVTVGPPSIAEESGIAALTLVRSVFALVGVAGFLVAGAVLLVCWRMLLDDDRPTLARLRLVGAKPRDLAVGSGVVFGLAALLCAAIGIPLGFLIAKGLDPLSQEVVSLSGLAGVVDSGFRVGPAVLGLAGVLLLCGVAWATGVRSLLRVSPVEGFRGAIAEKPRPIRLGPALVIATVLVAAFGVAVATLPTKAAGMIVLLAIAATVALARVAPTLAGNLLARREGFVSLAAGREFSAQARKRAGMVSVFAVANVLVVMLFGVASSLQDGVHDSVKGWAGSDLFVLAGEPGRALRDERLAPDTPERLEDIDGVATVTPFRLTFLTIKSKPVQLWAWETATANQTADLRPTDGLEGQKMWDALGDGGVAVSGNYAYQHDIEVGDTIEFPTSSGTAQHEVVSIIPEYTVDGGVIYSSLETFEDVTGDERNYDILLDLEEGANIDTVIADVESELTDYPGAVVWTGTQLLNSILAAAQQAFSVLNTLGVTCLVLALLVGASTSASSIAARRAPLAMTRVIGASMRDTRRQLWLESSVMGLAAWLIALPIGIPAVGAALDAMGSSNGLLPPTVIPWASIVVILPLTIIAMVAAMWLASRNIAKADVVSVLRDE